VQGRELIIVRHVSMIPSTFPVFISANNDSTGSKNLVLRFSKLLRAALRIKVLWMATVVELLNIALVIKSTSLAT